MNYDEFFAALTDRSAFPYQTRLAAGDWPEVVDVPTGLGKTNAILVAWLYRLLEGDAATGRRLVYCLPMRVLVEQTYRVASELVGRAAKLFEARGLGAPSVHAMLGGFVDDSWEMKPDAPAVLVGTQDMLLSRALARGYGMSRYKWPIHFGLLHNDCLWVLDETQLMGVGVETSAQLEAFRRRLGAHGPAQTVWMSATVGHAQLETVDHPRPQAGWRILGLGPADHDSALVQQRIGAHKRLERAPFSLVDDRDAYAATAAEAVIAAHRDRGGLTLIVVNRVENAQAIYGALSEMGVETTALIHSRFRPGDRRRHEKILHADGDRIVVATQAVEAGVDVSARTLFTELAPWPSLVQRFGRCNRYGEHSDARAIWIDLDETEDAAPYEASSLSEARVLLHDIEDVGPRHLAQVRHEPPRKTRPVLRIRDILDVFDTTPDLLGNDVDISQYVRDDEDTDVLVYFQEFDGEPGSRMTAPDRDELVHVSLAAIRKFMEQLRNKRRSLGDGERDRDRKRWARVWSWNPLDDRAPWTQATEASVFAGHTLLVHAAAGGYSSELGWTGEVLPKHPVPVVLTVNETPLFELMDADPRTAVDRWVTLRQHLGDVGREAKAIVDAVGLKEPLCSAVVTAAIWHDLGKAHAEFQRRLLEPVRDEPTLAPQGGEIWAKSAHKRRPHGGSRPYFRHELASALAWLQCSEGHPARDLVAYLIAAHHGKVRLSIRSVPGEYQPDEPDRLFARGVWHGDRLPEVTLPDGSVVAPVELDLSPMSMGEGSWVERMLTLRDAPDLGPFRLAYLETAVRIADWRASEKERRGE